MAKGGFYMASMISRAHENHIKHMFNKKCDTLCQPTCHEHKLCRKKRPDLYYAEPSYDPNNVRKILCSDDD